MRRILLVGVLLLGGCERQASTPEPCVRAIHELGDEVAASLRLAGISDDTGAPEGLPVDDGQMLRLKDAYARTVKTCV